MPPPLFVVMRRLTSMFEICNNIFIKNDEERPVVCDIITTAEVCLTLMRKQEVCGGIA